MRDFLLFFSDVVVNVFILEKVLTILDGEFLFVFED